MTTVRFQSVAAQRAHLRFFTWTAFCIVGCFALFDAVMAVVYVDAAIAFCGGVFVLYEGVLLWALARMERDAPARISLVIAVGLLVVGLLVTAAFPGAANGALVVPLAVVAMLLQHHSGRRLLWLIVAAGATAYGITLAGELIPPWTAAPPWLVAFYRVNASFANVALLLVLLWQFHQRMTGALSEANAANSELSAEVDERRAVERERERLIGQLEANNAELERFAYTVSHDLKTPLITVQGFLGHVTDDLAHGRTDRVAGDLERVRSAAATMARQLDDVLDLSRVGRVAHTPTPVPFAEVVEEALALTRGRLDAHGVQVEVAVELPVVTADRARLVEVVQNLVDNAAKFSAAAALPTIEIGARAEPRGPVFYVRDNGCGVDPAHHDVVFGLFDQIDAASEGTGVGLALVKRIIEVHGGSVWVESDGEGQGSTFCFTLAAGPA